MRSIPVPGKPGDTVPVDRETLADILTVLRYVSRGRGYLQVSYAYPDAAARKALGALSNAGLNPTPVDATPTRPCARHGDAMHPITSQGDLSPVETGLWSCPSCQAAFRAAVDRTVA
jgi:hypothetical protein